MTASQGKIRRCAVYTRKSSEEGLEQDFNSLQAQREAGEAYIRSQRSEGWRLISTVYDDGGISGGTMDRPALQRLLADIQLGLVDVIVVYKVDRLTRSLSDFSKMVEVFDKFGVSFVAVTQHFNTTTSMGRLTLNVLLSFAQFEREVTGERIRDKVTASKRKGIWMGGNLPRGYRVEDRKLIVVPEEAEEVRTIYRLYLASSGVRDLCRQLYHMGITGKDRLGNPGKRFSLGALMWVLKNPIYIGLLAHKGELHPGQHESIVDRPIWDAVQEKWRAAKRGDKQRRTKGDPSPLIGKLFDEAGRPLTRSHSASKGRRYRYYVSQPADLDADRAAGHDALPWRLPAKELERRIADLANEIIADRASIAGRAVAAGFAGSQITAVLRWVDQVEAKQILEHVDRVQLFSDQIDIEVKVPAPNELKLRRSASIALKRRGNERRIVILGKTDEQRKPDARIIRMLSVGHRFWEQMNSDAPMTAVDFGRAEGVDDRFVGRSMQLAFLAPDLIEMFVAGRQPEEWTAEKLLRWDPLPLSWDEQRKVIGG